MHVLQEISSKAMESTASTSNAISKLSQLASQLRKTVSGFVLPNATTGTGILSQEEVAVSLEREEALASDEKLKVEPPVEQRLQSG
jgi:hypothetical protein